MKNYLIYIIIAGCIAQNVILYLRNDKKSTPINYELFEYMVGEIDTRIDSLELQIKITSYEITKDSNFVFSSDRNTRDSLRAIVNPR